MKFQDSVPHEALQTLHALALGQEFAAEGHLIGVMLPGGEWYEVPAEHLAVLEERAFVKLTDEDPVANMPGRIDVTQVGKDYLRRWMLINRIDFVYNKRNP